MKLASITFILLIIISPCLSQIDELQLKLFEMPDVIFTQIEQPLDYHSAYKVYIKQPLDHQHPDKGYFYQKVYLSHMGFDRPTTIITEGYHRNQNVIYELSRLTNANQIDVEHRYYGESIPDSLDYQYLTLEQATADLHRINTLFKEIYTHKWISTGISKGGQTTIYYRYFYPDDVDISIPYVAPMTQGLEDPRIYDFLSSIGTEECRNKIYNVQKNILEDREESFTRMYWYSIGAGLDFNYLDFDEAMEYSVLEYPFSFWQWGGKCEDIPNQDADIDEILQHFIQVSDIGFFSDRDMEVYKSHYYQAGTQMGYYGYETEDFKGLLKALPEHSNPSAVFMPNKMDTPFDGSLAKKVNSWIKQSGNKFIYINGVNDTWFSTAVQPNKKLDALWINMENTDHGKARIRNMTHTDRAKLISKLESWLGMELDDIFKK